MAAGSREIQVGTLLCEDDPRWGFKLWTVKALRKNGSAVLVRAEDSCSTEGETGPKFKQQVESGEFSEWQIVSTRTLEQHRALLATAFIAEPAKTT